MALITVKELQALGNADDGRRVSMGNSLYGTVRIGSDGGVSVYVVWRYKIEGRVRQVPVGTWKDKGGMSLKAISDRRNELAVDLKAGIDPIERKVSDKLKIEADKVEAIQTQLDRLEDLAAKASRLTIKDLFTTWQTLKLRSRSDKGSEVQRSFERDVFPLIGDLAVADVAKANVQKIVDTIMERATESQNMVRTAKKTLADLRQMFGFAMDRDYIDADPTARIKKATIGKDTERSRVLNEQEIIDLFAKLPKSGMVVSSQGALMVQLGSMARIGEVLSAKWSDVDLERGVWTLPKTKNGKPHTIYLSQFTIGQFKLLQTSSMHSAWVFPASPPKDSTEPVKHVDLKTVTKQVADRQRTGEALSGRTQKVDALMLSGGQWRPHDLRRTGASKMAELGALPDVIERCLNHTEENKMKRIYQRATYEGPMRDAWMLWGERLELLQLKAHGKALNVRQMKRA